MKEKGTFLIEEKLYRWEGGGRIELSRGREKVLKGKCQCEEDIKKRATPTMYMVCKCVSSKI